MCRSVSGLETPGQAGFFRSSRGVPPTPGSLRFVPGGVRCVPAVYAWLRKMDMFAFARGLFENEILK